MVDVIVGEHESIDAALKRFTKRVQADGVLSEYRRREHYEGPGVRRRRKAAAAARKAARRLARAARR